MDSVVRAAAIVLRMRGYLFGFAAAALAVFLLFIYVPARLVPGNDFFFQLQLMSIQSIALLLFLSLLIALSLMMQVYVWRKLRDAKTCLASASSGVVGWFAALAASLFGTATCAACVGVLFGFLGFGTVLLLVEYRTPIVIVSCALVFASLHLSSRYVNEMEAPFKK